MTKSAEKWIKMRLTEEYEDAKKYFESSLVKRNVNETEYWRGETRGLEKALLIFKEATK